MGELVYKYDNPTTKDLSQTSLRLTCVCASQSFSYAVESVGDDSVLHLRTLEFDRNYHLFSEPLGFLDQVMRDDRMLYERFDQKLLLLRGLPFRLDFASREGEESQAATSLGPALKGAVDRLLTDRSETFGTTLSYAVPEVFMKEVALFFRGADIRHSVSGLICSTYHVRNYDHSCIVQVSSQWLEVVIVSESKLAFANHYRWYDASDITYYLAAVAEQAKLKELHYVFFGSHCDHDLVEQLRVAFRLEEDRYDHLVAPHNRLMDLSALAACG